MKAIYLSLALVVTLSSLTFAQDPAKIFEVKSGHIEYQLTGNTEGTRSFWWDDFGVKQYTLEKSTTTVKMFGIKDIQETHMLTIKSGDDFYTIDYIEDYAAHSRLDGMTDMAGYMTNNYTDAEKEEIRDNTLASMGGTITGTEMILNRKCEIMEIAGSKSWVYKQIHLKSDTKVMGIRNIETAIRFDENIPVPAAKFIPPEMEYDDLTGQNTGLWNSDEEDDDYSDIPPPPISLDLFCNKVNALPENSYTVNSCQNIDNNYMAMVRSNAGMINITASHSEVYEEAEAAGEMPEESEILNINGHKALYVSKIYDEEEGEFIDMSMLIVFYPDRNVNVSFIGVYGIGKTELISAAKHFKL